MGMGTHLLAAFRFLPIEFFIRIFAGKYQKV